MKLELIVRLSDGRPVGLTLKILRWEIDIFHSYINTQFIIWRVDKEYPSFSFNLDGKGSFKRKHN